MKKVWVVWLLLVMAGCGETEISDIVDRYNSSHKSEELKGYWEYKGIYSKKDSLNSPNIWLASTEMKKEDILLVEGNDLIPIHKGDNRFSTFWTQRCPWFNDDRNIYYLTTVGEFRVDEYKWKYEFGATKDTLKITNNSKSPVYFIRTEPVDYEVLKL